jgi:hypothetical protein
MYLDQAGLCIAAVGPVVAATGLIAKCQTFGEMSDMSGHVGHFIKCRTFRQMSDRLRPARTLSVGPALPNGFEELFRVRQVAFKSYLESDQRLSVNSLQCLNF